MHDVMGKVLNMVSETVDNDAPRPKLKLKKKCDLRLMCENPRSYPHFPPASVAYTVLFTKLWVARVTKYLKPLLQLATIAIKGMGLPGAEFIKKFAADVAAMADAVLPGGVLGDDAIASLHSAVDGIELDEIAEQGGGQVDKVLAACEDENRGWQRQRRCARRTRRAFASCATG